ncbi:hypothetical protein COU58_00200 [Candidatus Pacearchaeota archaeon CG10_big_fil_rev_8_21_14_0_10_32_42]|nr:MAG: hypothetical protein COU58_00200 [Candidatus Pacearchaeota archaeon CG10_big_fil_rev_8_21_14_0_10_32_42]
MLINKIKMKKTKEKSYYKIQKDVKYPNLNLKVSRGLEYYLRLYFLDASKADFILLKKMTLDHLKCAEINQNSYDGEKKEFLITEAIYLSINELYNTNHSWADMDKYLQLTK